MLKDFVALPIFILFTLCIVIGEKWTEEHQRAEDYKKELEECLEIERLS